MSYLQTYNTPADEAYFYYASRDPLNAGVENGDGPTVGAGSNPVLRGMEVTSNGPRPRAPPGGATSLESGEAKDAERRKKAQYAQELQRQMAEVRLRGVTSSVLVLREFRLCFGKCDKVCFLFHHVCELCEDW